MKKKNIKKMGKIVEQRGDLAHLLANIKNIDWVQAHSWLVLETNQDMLTDAVNMFDIGDIGDVDTIHGLILSAMNRIKLLHNDEEDFRSLFNEFLNAAKTNKTVVQIAEDMYTHTGATYPEFNANDHDKVRLALFAMLHIALQSLAVPEDSVSDADDTPQDMLSGMDLTKFTNTDGQVDVSETTPNKELNENHTLELGEKVIAYGRAAHKVVRKKKSDGNDTSIAIAASTSTQVPENVVVIVDSSDNTSHAVKPVGIKNEVMPTTNDKLLEKLFTKFELDSLAKRIKAVSEQVASCKTADEATAMAMDTIMEFIYSTVHDVTRRRDIISAISNGGLESKEFVKRMETPTPTVPTPVKSTAPVYEPRRTEQVQRPTLTVGKPKIEVKSPVSAPKYNPDDKPKGNVLLSKDEKLRDLQTMSRAEFCRKWHNCFGSEIAIWGQRDLILSANGLTPVYQEA